MSNLQVFQNREFGVVRTVEQDGKVMFCGKDVAGALGYVDTAKAIKQHCKEDGWAIYPVIDNLNREQQAKFISEGNLYRLIANSKLPSAEKFERWVFDDVLPTIRKHGMYAAEELLANPDLFIHALQELKAEREKKRNLELAVAQNKQIIAELSPKATYYDLILQNKSTMAISHIAKDYGRSAKSFNKLLHELGVQFKQGKTWLLYQHYADKGYTQSRTHVLDAEKSIMHTYWTQKGRLFLYDLLKNERQLLPMIEREF